MPKKDFYEVLGVSRTATLDEIKKAYKKLAIRWHPDKNPEDQAHATEMFKAVGEAYETLSDPGKRREYDYGSSMRGTGADDADNFGPGSPFSFSHSYSGSSGASRSGSGRFSHQSSFSDRRAFDIFNQVFAEMDEMHRNFMGGGMCGSGFDDDVNDMFRAGNRHSTGAFRGGFGGFGGSLFEDILGGGDSFARMQSFDGSGAMASFSSSSFSSSSGGRGGTISRSVSTSTYIGADGRKVTRKETTVVHLDGTRESNVEETTEEAAPSNRLGYASDFTRNNSRGYDNLTARDARDRRSLPVSMARDFSSDLRRMSSQASTTSTSSKSSSYSTPSMGSSRNGGRK